MNKYPKTPKPVMIDCKEASKQVSKHGYCHDTQTLRVEFKSGIEYDYHNIPPETYVDMCAKGISLGGFLNTRIKMKYKFTKLPKKEGPTNV